jgi:hypothetical protein
MNAREYGQPLDVYHPLCPKCHESKLHIVPQAISEHVLENWPARMHRVLPDLKYGCDGCGALIAAANLQWRKL